MTALPTRSASCPPAQKLEAHFAGESMPDVDAHLPSCATCRTYLTELETEQAAFRVRYPTESLVAKHSQPRAPKRWPSWALGFAVAAAGLLALWLIRPADDVHFKGGRFSVLVQSKNAAPRVVAPDERLRNGDALRFRFVVPQDGHFAILDRDARGASVLLPAGANAPIPVTVGAPELLPGSIALDDSVGPEWLVAVFSPSHFEVAPLLEALRQRPASQRPTVSCADCEIEMFRFEKVK